MIFLFCRLNQRSKHNTNAKEIADVCKVHIKIPTEQVDVVKNSETCNTSYKPECAINCVENQLCGSVFNHGDLLLLFYFNKPKLFSMGTSYS